MAFPDRLTHTTLVLDPHASPVLLLHLKRKLHDVPGVLYANVRSHPNEATVSHDGAVDVSILLAAARSLGIVASVPTVAARLPVLSAILGRRVRATLAIVTVAAIATALADVITHLNPADHWLTFFFLLSMCMLIAAIGVSTQQGR